MSSIQKLFANKDLGYSYCFKYNDSSYRVITPNSYPDNYILIDGVSGKEVLNEESKEDLLNEISLLFGLDR